MTEAELYIAGFGSQRRRAYAQAYWRYLLRGYDKPAREGLTYGDAQAIRMDLDDILREADRSYSLRHPTFR